MITDTTPGWDLLASVVRARRSRLGLTQSEVADSGGPSVSTQHSLEKQSTPLALRTLRKFDTALKWESGIARALTSGDSPSVVDSWDDFLSSCIHDSAPILRLTFLKTSSQSPPHPQPNLSTKDTLESLNLYLVHAQYLLTVIKDNLPATTPSDIAPLNNVIRKAHGVVLDELRKEDQDDGMD